MSKSIFYTGGKFYVGDGQFADSVFSKDGVIVAIGDGSFKDQADQVVDLTGRFIAPDFINDVKNVEYDFEEIHDEELIMYNKKMSKFMTSDKEMPGLKVGDETNLVVYDEDFTDLQRGRYVESKRLIAADEVVYDEEDFRDEQMYRLLINEHF